VEIDRQVSFLTDERLESFDDLLALPVALRVAVLDPDLAVKLLVIREHNHDADVTDVARNELRPDTAIEQGNKLPIKLHSLGRVPGKAQPRERSMNVPNSRQNQRRIV